MNTIAINSDDFVQYGCPCCCKFSVNFLQFVINAKIMKCNNTQKMFYVVINKEESCDIPPSIASPILGDFFVSEQLLLYHHFIWSLPSKLFSRKIIVY